MVGQLFDFARATRSSSDQPENRGELPLSLLRELRRRRVFRTAALYIVSAWVVLQVASLALAGLDIPAVGIRYVWIGAALGFPVAIAFGWRYQITEKGIVRSLPAQSTENTDVRLRRSDYVLLTALLAVTGAMVVGVIGEIRDVGRPFGVSSLGRLIDPDSIAVLPLDNLTGDNNQDFFVDGLHNLLISGLSQISALTVTSRTSAMRYRNSNRALIDIAGELGVANIIEGSVFAIGDEIRITVQLIAAATDELIWAQSFRRDVKDVIALQGDIARSVADEVGITLSPDEVNRLTAASRQINPEVYNEYLRGMFFINQLTPESIPVGLDHLQNAVALDPRDPLAYAGLALGFNTIGHGVDAHGAFPSAISNATKALELDELSGEAWAALGEAQLYYQWDWRAAEESMLRALQLSPSLDHVRAHYSYLLALREDFESAYAEAERARSLSPLDPIWAGFAAWLYMLEERWDEGIDAAEECLRFNPEFPLCIYALGQIYSASGDIEQSLAVHSALPVGTEFRQWSLGISYALAGREADSRAIISEMQADPTPRDELHIALAYSALGEFDAAIEWLERAYESRSDWLPWVVLENAYGGSVEPIRDDPRFQVIVDQLNLPLGDAAASLPN